ncbi:MAG: DUF6519 domain-containing protein [candidate division WOR-3 bacterium]
MKGDFSRRTYDRKKNYKAVLEQQGRVHVDADANEHADIVAHERETRTYDIVGRCGAPVHDAGFEIRALNEVAGGLLVSSGRYYVDGLLCELHPAARIPVEAVGSCRLRLLEYRLTQEDITESPWILVFTTSVPAGVPTRVTGIEEEGRVLVLSDSVSGEPLRLARLFLVSKQPGFAPPSPWPPVSPARYLVYLDVWERHITAIEDPDIREVALGGPDTATRIQTTAQVKLHRVDGNPTCREALLQMLEAHPLSRGCLTTSYKPPVAPTDPCQPAGGGGYRGLENRLYRVEIHDPGDIGTATFKWSRDNGAITYAVAEGGFVHEPSGNPECKKLRLKELGRDQYLQLKPGQWVEVSTDETDLGEEPSSIIAQVTAVDETRQELALDRDVSALKDGGHPKVRRWDTGGETPSVPTNVTGDQIELEDGIFVRFSGDNFRPGDYWVFAARTATRSVDILDAAPAMGIKHRYCPLALVTWGPNNVPVVTDCRRLFPPLTELGDGDEDRRRHNRLLHGWGVVCGLQVHCAGRDHPDRVRVEEGYAIARDGSEIIANQNAAVDIVDMAEEQGLVKNGEGRVCLEIGRNAHGDPEFIVSAPDGTANEGILQRTLNGSLLKSVVDNCISPLLELLRGIAQKPEHAHLRTALLNLGYQLYNEDPGKHIFLSQVEHDLLKDFYDWVKEAIAAKDRTFCGLFDTASAFPGYPDVLQRLDMKTAFGDGRAARVRLSPDSSRAYVFGPDTADQLQVFSLPGGEPIAKVTVPANGNETVEVQDVAFFTIGRAKRLLVSATRGGKSTLTVFDSTTHQQVGSSVTVEGVRVLRLATVSGSKMLAVGLGKGLYTFDASGLKQSMFQRPGFSFNATGHLVVDSERAYVTAREGTQPGDVYTKVLAYTYGSAGAEPTTFEPLSGTDGIAVLPGSGNRRARLYVVVTENGQKKLWWFDATKGGSRPSGVVDLKTTGAVGVAAASDGQLLVLSIADKFELARVDINNNLARSLPVQIVPRGLAVTPNGSLVVVANNGSGTLNITRKSEVILEPGAVYQALEPYRRALLDTFTDLAWRTLQALKDCACGQFLRDCPDMTYAPVPLALVTIREGKVYHICNFGCRQELVTFPKLGYWLSAVPAVQLVVAAVAQFCCSVLPAPKKSESGSGGQFHFFVRQAMGLFAARPTDFTRHAVEIGQGLKASPRSPLLASALQRIASGLTSFATPEILVAANVVGQDEKTAIATLGERGVEVAEVKPYAEITGRNLLADLAGGLAGIMPGDKVNVYTDAGKVVCIVKAEDDVPAKSAAETAEIRRLKENIASLQTELTQLKQKHADIEKKAAKGTADIASLKEKLGQLSKMVKPKQSPKK